MSDGYLPIVRKSDIEFVVMVEKELSNQIPIYKKDENGDYIFLGPANQNSDYERDFQDNKYFIKEEDKNYLYGGNKTKRRQYRYRYSSKKRVASQRRGRGRQTRYSRRK
jgi:hypothetical protein